MPLKKCEYCRYRGRASQMPRHLRHCLPARRAKRKELNKVKIAELVNPEDIIITPGTKSIKLKDNSIPVKKGRKKKNETN